MTTIRIATAADFDSVLRFHEALYRVHRDRVVNANVLPLIDYQNLGDVLAEDVRALLKRANTRVLIAEDNGVAVGYISGRIEVDRRRIEAKKGIIEDWYVVELSRGKGIGQMLFAQLADWFRSLECTVVESMTWTSNQRARALHERLGFEEIHIMYRKRL